MSALPPKSDMVQHDRDVGFVPKADIAHFHSIISSASAITVAGLACDVR
jgi:hypothetical protein